ncbi:MAG TPA: RNA-binding S4 domain-containing protein [Clostridia bacterium]|nr:RNA-binding S4 domain-containing protein [Clostridia bacterium]
MRLDKFLKVSRLIKRRAVAKEACQKGRVLVNGRPGKAGTEVKPGDKLTILFGSKTIDAVIEKIYEPVPAKKAPELYKIIDAPDQ